MDFHRCVCWVDGGKGSKGCDIKAGVGRSAKMILKLCDSSLKPGSPVSSLISSLFPRPPPGQLQEVSLSEGVPEVQVEVAPELDLEVVPEPTGDWHSVFP